MKIVFFGTSEFAKQVLKAIVENSSDIEVCSVYTKAGKPFGRKQEIKNSDVFEYASLKGLNIETPKTLRDEDVQNKIKALNADVGIVAAYGLILPQAVLDIFPLGCINIHGSVLPKLRGAAPIQRTIMNGDKTAGVTIMQMDAGIDTGDMLLWDEINISGKTFDVVLNQLAEMGGNLIVRYLNSVNNGSNLSDYPPVKQDDALATYADKITNDDCVIDFSCMTAGQIVCKVLALNPAPKAFFFDKLGNKVFVLMASVVSKDDYDNFVSNTANIRKKKIFVKCADDTFLSLDVLQKEGKKILPVADFLNGNTVEF